MNSFTLYISHVYWHAQDAARNNILDAVEACNGVIRRVDTGKMIREVEVNSGLVYEYTAFYDRALFNCSEDMLVFKLRHPDYISETPYEYSGYTGR